MYHYYSHIRDELAGVLPEDQFGLDDEESMNLHYFKIHDKDKNNKLDGLELGMLVGVV